MLKFGNGVNGLSFGPKSASRLASAMSVVLFTAALSACGSTSPNAQKPGATTDSNGAVALPLDAFTSSFTDMRRLVFEAEGVKVSVCMAKAGFDYPASKYGQPDLFAGEYGLLDEHKAAQYGYTTPEVDNAPDLMEVENAKLPKDPNKRKAYIEAMDGPEQPSVVLPMGDPATPKVGANVPLRGGCVGAADEALFGSSDTYGRFEALQLWAEQVVQVAQTTALASGDGLQAQQDWSSCMSKAGYAYQSILDIGQVAWETPRPSTHEIAVATTDVHCKATTNYLHRVRTSERVVQQTILDKNPGVLDEMTTLRQRIKDSITARTG